MGLRYDLPMSWKSPVSRHPKRDILTDKRFFDRLAQKCVRFTNRDAVFVTYMMAVELIEDDLNAYGIARLPHLGHFVMTEQKPRPGFFGKAHVMLPARKSLRFYVNYFIRRQFNKRQDF